MHGSDSKDPGRGTPIGLLNGMQWELAPLGEP